MQKERMCEIKRICYDFLKHLTDDSDTTEFINWTATLTGNELRFCQGVFKLYEYYLQGRVSEDESKSLYDNFVKNFM